MLFSQSDSGLYLPRPSEWAYSRGIKILVAGDPRRDLVNRTFTNVTVSSGSYSISPSVMGLAWSNTSASSVNSVGNIAPNASWTALIVANPVSQANRHAAIVQNGGVGAFQLGFNFNDQFTASAGRFAVTSLETGVNRSHAYVASAADGNPHAFLMRKSGTSISAWIDGVSKSVTSSGGFTGNPSSATDSIKLYGTSTDSGNAFVGGSSIAAVAYFGQALSDGECARLSEHYSAVWSKLLRPEELFVWIPDSAGGDASASLTGTAGTTSAGNAAPSISASISGVSATSAVGSVSPSTGATASLSGTASTASVGSLSQSVTVAATGVQVSTASGVSTVGMSKDLTGNPSTASVGTLSPSVGATATLSGTATTTTTGSLAATLSITLGGVSTTASVGTLTLPGSYSAALNANQATASIGSIAPSVSNAIGGVQSATAVGASSSAGVSRSVTGNSSSANAGALAATLSVTVAGTSTSTAVGALSVPGSYSAELGSSAVSSLVGSLTTSVSVGVSGTLATTSVGTLTRTTAVIGSQTNTAVGALTVSVTNAVTGRSVIASSGSPLVAGGSFSASLYGNILATSSGLLTVLGAIPGPGESVNLYSRLATTKTLSSRIPQ